MGLFGKKKVSASIFEYKLEKLRAIFTVVRLIKDGRDLDTFMEMYDLALVS